MRRRTYVATVGSALVGGCLGFGGDGGPGTATGTGTSGAGGEPPVAFERQWKTSLGIDRLNSVHISTATDSDGIYTTHDRGMTALDLADGTERWANPTTRTFDALAADGDGVFAVWTTGEVLAVDPESGDVRWERGESGQENVIYGPVLTTSDHVAASGPGGIVVYAKADGQRVATLAGQGTLLAAHDGGFLVDTSTGLARYEPDGTVGWRVEDVPYTFGHDAAVAGTGLVVAGDRGLVAVDPADGTKRWTESVDADFMDANMTAAGGVAFVSGGFDRNAVYAVDVESGKRLWNDTLDGIGPFPMAALDSALVVEDGEKAQARDLRTGETLDSIQAGYEKSIFGTAARGRTFVGVGRTVYGYHV